MHVIDGERRSDGGCSSLDGGGASGAKGSVDSAKAQELLDKIAEIDKIFWETKKA